MTEAPTFALRLALDDPEAATHLIAMDGVPIAEARDRLEELYSDR